MTDQKQDTETGKFSIFSLVGSMFAGWFGVQTNSNRERDFQQGKFHHFVIGGIIFAVLFVLLVVGIVKIVMSTAGA